ncbi:MAG: transporter substrate-binding domain-containing protein [Bacilli bacterium]
MKKLLFMVLFLLTILVGCASEKEINFEDGKLIVGLEAAYSPFNWLENEATESNHPLDGMNAFVEGYDVQMAKLIAEELGLELVIKRVEWKGIITALKTGMIDLIIAGMSPTEERLESINFSNSYYESDHVVIVRKDSIYASATSIEDFTNAKVIGQKNTIYDDLAVQIVEANTGSVHQTALDTVPRIVNSINTGVSDITVVEKPVAISIVNNNENLMYIDLTSDFVLDESDRVVSIGIRKVDSILLERVNVALGNISLETRENIMLSMLEVAPGDE